MLAFHCLFLSLVPVNVSFANPVAINSEDDHSMTFELVLSETISSSVMVEVYTRDGTAVGKL